MIVLDASTLILLAKTDLLGLLAEHNVIAIPPAVEQEALKKPKLFDAQAIKSYIDGRKIRVSKVGNLIFKERIRRDFSAGEGETEALVLAKAENAALGTDDGVAIKAAKILGVPFFTAMHVLIELHEKGRLTREQALAKLDRLATLGRYDTRIVEDARRRLAGGR